MFNGSRCGYVWVACLVLGGALAAATQGGQPAAGAMGTVIVSVKDAETGLPLRYAGVKLVPKPAAVLRFPSFVPQPVTVRLVSGVTGPDGSLHMEGVPVGNYLVGVTQMGYVTPGEAVELDEPDSVVRKVLASLPVVHVAAGQVARLSLAPRRGAVLTGRVHFRDGSPVVGVPIEWQLKEGFFQRSHSPGERASALMETLETFGALENRQKEMTNDRGEYRIAGLPPGRYLLTALTYLDPDRSANVTRSNGTGGRTSGQEHLSPELIPVFAPGVYSRSKAGVIAIRGTEEVRSDITVDPAGLHTVRGTVLSKLDRHAPRALVYLREADTKETPRMVEAKADGSFEIHDLDPGNYVLQVMAADWPTNAQSASMQRQYRTARIPVTVRDGDVALGEVMVTPAEKGERVEPDL